MTASSSESTVRDRSRDAGATTVLQRNERYWVAVGPTGDLRGDAREKDGVWTVSKTQWAGANGDGRVAGFPGGPLVVGTVAGSCSKQLRIKLIKAMLGCLV